MWAWLGISRPGSCPFLLVALARNRTSLGLCSCTLPGWREVACRLALATHSPSVSSACMTHPAPGVSPQAARLVKGPY